MPLLKESIVSALIGALAVLFLAALPLLMTGVVDVGLALALISVGAGVSFLWDWARHKGYVMPRAEHARGGWHYTIHAVKPEIIEPERTQIAEPKRVALPEPASIDRVRLVTVHTSSQDAPTEIAGGQNGDTLRLVNVPKVRMIDDAPEDDLREFIDLLTVRGLSWRRWRGHQFESGRKLKDYSDFTPLIAPLVKAGLIVGRGERASGELVTDDATEIKMRLGLIAPLIEADAV